LEEELTSSKEKLLKLNAETSGLIVIKNFFSLSLTTRPNKLEHFLLETLSSCVLEFEDKARANPIGGPCRCFLFG